MTDESRVEAVLAAMADPTRRQILEILAESSGSSATIVSARLPVSRQAVVKHLGVLDHAGLVVGTRHGREVRYAVRVDRLRTAGQWLIGQASLWGPPQPEPDPGAPAAAEQNLAEQNPAEQAGAAPAQPAAQPARVSLLAESLAEGSRLAGLIADHLYRALPSRLAGLVPPPLRR